MTSQKQKNSKSSFWFDTKIYKSVIASQYWSVIIIILLFTDQDAINSRGFGFENKAQRLFPSDKFMGGFWGLQQVNALRGVFGGDGVKRVVCRYRWVCFGCLLKGVLSGGYHLIPIYKLQVIYGFIDDHETSQLYFG